MNLLSSLLSIITQRSNKSWRIYQFFSGVLPTPTRLVRTVPIKIVIPLHQAGVWTAFKKWETRETETLDWIDSFPTSSVFVDIGASFGNETLYAALKNGGPREIIAFDIDLQTSYNLACNLMLNGITNVTQYYLALGSKYGFVHASEPTQYTTLEAQHMAKISYLIPSMPLDEVLVHMGKQPTHIKIDVDGAEVAVVQGMSQTLRNPLLQSLLIEVSHDTQEPITQLLAQAGFIEVRHSDYARSGGNTCNIIFRRS